MYNVSQQFSISLNNFARVYFSYTFYRFVIQILSNDILETEIKNFCLHYIIGLILPELKMNERGTQMILWIYTEEN